MSKAGTETTDAPKRAPRKRAVRRVVNDTDTPVRRTRATAAKVTKEEVTAIRKAPVHINVSAPKSSTRQFVVALATFVVVVGTASWIGFSDAGQINVNERINSSNQDAADITNAQAGAGESVTVPVQNTPPAAISGIRPRTDGGGQPAPVPEVTEVATTTGSSTDEVTTPPPTESNDETGIQSDEDTTTAGSDTTVTSQ